MRILPPPSGASARGSLAAYWSVRSCAERETMNVHPSLFLAARVVAFASNPARDPEAELLVPAIAPVDATLSATNLRARSCVDRGEVRTVRACTLEQLARANGNGDFSAPPRAEVDGAPDPAAEQSAYYHAARARSFYERLAGQSLPRAIDVVAGFRTSSAVAPEAMLEPFAGAFYLRAGELPPFDAVYGVTRDTVWLGRGAERDVAYDGDIVAHEMGHAMLDGVLEARGFRLAPYGASAEPGATSEALADYFAASMSDDPVLGEWTSSEPGAAGAYRSLETFVECPAGIDGRFHDESLLLSGALWSTRQALARDARDGFDAAVYRAITKATIGGADLASALDVEAPRFRGELERRRVGCAPIVPLTGALRGTRGAFYTPGTDAVGATSIAPGILQLRVEVAPGATRLEVDLEIVGVVPAFFSGARSPFAPVVVVSWDAELRWEGERSNAAAEAPANGDPLARAELAVPPGARVAYLQIANRGQSDGAYDYVTARMTSEAPSGNEPPLYASGSGCATSRPRGGGVWAAVLASALALIARRSRAGTDRRSSSPSTSPPSSSSSRR